MKGPLADDIVAVAPWLRGVAGNLSWLRGPLGPAPLLALGVVFAFALPKSERPEIRRTLVALAPFAAFLCLLSLAFQHQNIHFRFQAPAMIALLFALFRHAIPTVRSSDSPTLTL